MITIVRSIREEEWMRFLGGCDRATIYYTPGWKRFLDTVFPYKSHYLFAQDDTGEVVGVLPLFEVRSRLMGNRLTSAPFAHLCGPVGTGEAVFTLLGEAISLSERLSVDFLQINDLVGEPRFQRQNTFCSHILKLSPRIDLQWRRLDKGSVRWAIKKARRSGVTVDTSTSTADIRRFYELNCLTKKKLGVPAHSWDFFSNLFAALKENAILYRALYEGDMIAGGIMVRYNGTVLYAYGAASPDHLPVSPYNAFLWRSIEDACASGYRLFDFGRTAKTDSGLMHFKKRWGAIEQPLSYSFYPFVPRNALRDRAGITRRAMSKLIRHMPDGMYRWFSRGILKEVG